MRKYDAKVTRVVDGDTFDAIVELGFNMTIKLRFRLLFIDAPEMRGPERPEGIKSKEYVKEKLLGKKIIVETEKSDVFGRWLAVVYVNDENLNDTMVKEGYAVPYEK